MPPRALLLREGKAPVRDRLLAMLFLAGMLHGLLILGLTFNSGGTGKASAPGLHVLLVSDEVPEAEQNSTATYLANRTQLGSGNTQESLTPHSAAASIPIPAQEGTPDGDRLEGDADKAGDANERVLTTSGWNVEVRYLADNGDRGSAAARPALLQPQPSEQPAPVDEAGPAALQGPKRDELWITPDTRAATLAPYLDAWRRKVERVGTINYPTAARHLGVKASPVVEVGIRSDGSLDRAVIRQSSGYPELDQAALEILKLASPFDPFPPELAHEHRVLRFAYEWQFVGGRVRAGGVSAVP
ncbi:MAG TPA: energy transducer TonB [Steroidobacteraceae bacterium]|nr:energy transducer TonB [Steroidobacteraceae bacterium]